MNPSSTSAWNCRGRLGLSQVVLIILPTSSTCCTSPTWFLPAPTHVGVCRQAVPYAPAEQLMCSGDARKKAGVLCVPTSARPAAAPTALGLCTGEAMEVLVPQRVRAVCRAYMCVSVWEVEGRNRSWAECAASTGNEALRWELVIQPCAMDTPALGMASRSSLISCIRTTSPCSSSLLALVISWKRLSVRPTSSTPMSLWCPTIWTSMMM